MKKLSDDQSLVLLWLLVTAICGLVTLAILLQLGLIQ